MRNSNEISAELDARMAEFEGCQGEERKTMAANIEALTHELQEAQIDEAARKALANQRVFTPAEQKDLRKFSISKFIRQALPGETMDGIEAEMAEEGKREFQASIKGSAEGVFLPAALLRYDYTDAVDTGYGDAFKTDSLLSYDGKLRGAMLGQKLGVKYLNGLQGNVSIVTGGADASWVAEEGSKGVDRPTYSKATLSPKRLQVLQGITYDLIHQSSAAVDALIMGDMVKAHAEKLDAAIFAGSGSSGQPTGVLSASGVNTIYTNDSSHAAAVTYAKLVEMETAVGEDNGLLDDTLAYVVNAKIQGKLKTIQQVNGYPYYLLNDGKANGYPCHMTNAIPLATFGGTSNCSSAIFGPWSQVLVGGWGGLQFIVDPYTAKNKGILEISAIAYHDVLVRHPAAFAVLAGITTS